MNADTATRTKHTLQGVALGAIATTIGLFYFVATTDSNAELLAKETADKAVVTALVPFCILNFQGQPDAPEQLVELKAASSYQRGGIVEKAGWATMPGGEMPNAAVARACAIELTKAAS